MVNPSRVAFSIFGRDIYWYGVLISISVVLAVAIGMRQAKRKGMNPDILLDFALLAIPCGVVGARLYYVIFEWRQFAANPIRALYIWEGGLAIYGVIIGGLVGALIFCKWKKLNFWRLIDLLAPGVALGQAIGRWGNFFNQEAYGPQITDPQWMWFPFAVRIDATQTIHMATFFYESVWCFCVFIFLMARRNKFKYDGDVFLWYILFYAFERMLIEGLRQDSLWLIPGSVRVSQLLSFLIIVAVAAFMVVREKRAKQGLVTLASTPIEAVAGADGADGVADADGAIDVSVETSCDCGCETDCDECEKECENVVD